MKTNSAPGGREVFVTGLGLVSPWGVGGKSEVLRLAGATPGERGIVRDGEPGRADRVGDLDRDGILGKRGLRHLTAGTVFLMSAARLAMNDAGFDEDDSGMKSQTGVVAGTVTCNAALVAEFDRVTLAEGPLSVNPAVFPQTVWNSPPSQTAIRFGLRGMNMTVASGLNSGLDAIVRGYRFLAAGPEKALLAGGFEELTPFYSGLYTSPVSRRAGREGSFGFSEGAAVLFMESGPSALSRGVRPIARIRGAGSAFIPGGPAGDRKAAGKRMLLKIVGESGIDPEQIRGIFSLDYDGSGTGPNIFSGPGEWPGETGLPPVFEILRQFGSAGGFSGALAASLAAAGNQAAGTGDKNVPKAGASIVVARNGRGGLTMLLTEPVP